MDAILEYFSYHPIEYYSFIGIAGLIIGSFLNVVIYRLPIMLKKSWQHECYEFLEIEKPKELTVKEKFNLIFPRSFCPKCKHQIEILKNIPIISYILLQGKCYHCKQPISLRYPAIEFLTATLSIMIAWQFGVSFLTILGLILTYCLITQAFIDLENTIIPDEITLPFLWIGLIINLFNIGFVPDISDALLGAVLGYLSLFLIYEIFKLTTKKEGIGFGDLKLFAMLGAWLGWQMLPQILIIASLVATIFGLINLFLRKTITKDTPIPFAPYIALAGYISMLWGNQINYLYLRYIGFN